MSVHDDAMGLVESKETEKMITVGLRQTVRAVSLVAVVWVGEASTILAQGAQSGKSVKRVEVTQAERAVAYDLQALGRAKVVGEVTGGGAHGTKPYRLSAHFIAGIPFNRATNTVTHGDYEGVGVKPDVQVPAEKALLTAHILALRGVLARTTDDAERKAELEKLIGELETKLKGGAAKE